MMQPTLWIGALCAALHFLVVEAEEMPSAAQPAAQTEEARTDEFVQAETILNQYQVRTIEALAATGKAREMALAAMMLYAEELSPALRVQQKVWWRRAWDTAAGDAMVVHMLVMGYRRAVEETAQDTELHQQAARLWHTLEPSNLAPMLYLEQPLESLLTQVGSSVYIDLHHYALGRWIHSTLGRHPPTAQELQALEMVNSIIPKEYRLLDGRDVLHTYLTLVTQNALSVPQYQKLRNACKPEELYLYPTRKTACEHIANVLINRSTTFIQEVVGIRMQIDLALHPEECQILKTRGLGLRWRRKQASGFTQGNSGWGYMQHFLRAPHIQREQDAIEDFLRQKGRLTEPPPDWTDRDAYTDAPC